MLSISLVFILAIILVSYLLIFVLGLGLRVGLAAVAFLFSLVFAVLSAWAKSRLWIIFLIATVASAVLLLWTLNFL
jgi:hypothetical protein